ncbi:hypothetical protein I3760_05G230200 [Carya illinoinensis]|nr:hypothetical protein I3760_05G230200 [Carya illinoinensis]
MGNLTIVGICINYFISYSESPLPPFPDLSSIFPPPSSTFLTRNLPHETCDEGPSKPKAPFSRNLTFPLKIDTETESSASPFEAERHQSSTSPFDAVSLPETLTKALRFSLPFPSFSFKFSLVQDISDVRWRNFRGN